MRGAIAGTDNTLLLELRPIDSSNVKVSLQSVVSSVCDSLRSHTYCRPDPPYDLDTNE